MKTLILIVLVLCSSAFAYTDMSNTLQQSNALNMTQSNYEFSMAIAGTFAGSIFGLFLWKVK